MRLQLNPQLSLLEYLSHLSDFFCSSLLHLIALENFFDMEWSLFSWLRKLFTDICWFNFILKVLCYITNKANIRFSSYRPSYYMKILKWSPIILFHFYLYLAVLVHINTLNVYRMKPNLGRGNWQSVTWL